MTNYISSLSSEQKNLLKAVQHCNLEDVNSLLEQAPNLTKDSEFGYLLVVTAIDRGNQSILRQLLTKECKVASTVKTKLYRTPLYYAVERGDFDLYKTLYERGADICGRDANLQTPLELVMQKQESQFWDFIVSKLNFKSLDRNCQAHIAIFHVACYRGDLQVVKKFMERKFSVNSRSDFEQKEWAGATPLQFALKSCEDTREVVRYLINFKIDYNIQDKEGNTPLLSTVEKYVEDNSYIDDIFREYMRLFVKKQTVNSLNPMNKDGLSHFQILCSLDWHRDGFEKDETKLLDILKYLIKKNVDINSANYLKENGDGGITFYAGYTALHWAALRSSPKVLELLLKNGADPKKIDASGKTPLHLLEFKSPHIVRMTELLLKYGADMDVEDFHGQTPLHLAFHSQKRNETLMQFLWSRSKRIVAHIDPWGLSYLHIASTRDLEDVEALVRNGAAVNSCMNFLAKSERGYTALHFAAAFNRVENVKYLLTHGAEANPSTSEKRIDTPLHLACTEGLKHFFGAQEEDVSNHVNPEIMDGVPAIHEEAHWVSSRNAQMQIIQLLLEHGSLVNSPNSLHECPLAAACHLPDTILDSYLEKYKNRILEEITIRRKMMISLLVRFGADVNSLARYGEPLIHTLYEQSHSSHLEVDVAKVLLEKGLNVDATNDKGFTSLHLAVINFTRDRDRRISTRQERDSSFIDLFLKFGANVNSKAKNCDSILHSALRSIASWYHRDHRSAFIKLLDQPNIDLDIQNQIGDTPLHLAVRLKNFSCVRDLINAGADINVENVRGDSPTQVLLSLQQNLLCELITEHLKKLLMLNYFVSEKNLFFLNISSVNFRNRTVGVDSAIGDEVLKLKSVKINKYTSLYEILMKDSSGMVNLVKNEAFRNIISSPKLENDFPLFFGFLKRQHKKGLSRGLILEPAEKALRVVTRVNWPDFCSEQILRHLSDDCLKNLIDSANESLKRSSKNLPEDSTDSGESPAKYHRST